MLTLTDLPERIGDKIQIVGDHWIWIGYQNSLGYGYVRWEGRDQPAHRITYRLLVGEFDQSLDVDHLCVTPSCVNPQHLEPVTHAENMRRIRDRQMACRKSGHDWTDPNNVRVRPNGSRYCAECDRVALRARYEPTGTDQNGAQSHCPKGHPYSGDNLIITRYPDGRFRQRCCRACRQERNRRRGAA